MVSLVISNFAVEAGVSGFLPIATIGVGNLFLLITTSINDAGKDIRKESSKLEKEYMNWIDKFFRYVYILFCIAMFL